MIASAVGIVIAYWDDLKVFFAKYRALYTMGILLAVLVVACGVIAEENTYPSPDNARVASACRHPNWIPPSIFCFHTVSAAPDIAETLAIEWRSPSPWREGNPLRLVLRFSLMTSNI